MLLRDCYRGWRWKRMTRGEPGETDCSCCLSSLKLFQWLTNYPQGRNPILHLQQHTHRERRRRECLMNPDVHHWCQHDSVCSTRCFMAAQHVFMYVHLDNKLLAPSELPASWSLLLQPFKLRAIYKYGSRVKVAAALHLQGIHIHPHIKLYIQLQKNKTEKQTWV